MLAKAAELLETGRTSVLHEHSLPTWMPQTSLWPWFRAEPDCSPPGLRLGTIGTPAILVPVTDPNPKPSL